MTAGPYDRPPTISWHGASRNSTDHRTHQQAHPGVGDCAPVGRLALRTGPELVEALWATALMVHMPPCCLAALRPEVDANSG